jgi:hypothetical protein
LLFGGIAGASTPQSFPENDEVLWDTSKSNLSSANNS